MTYTTPTWTEYFNQIVAQPYVQALALGLAIAVGMLLLLALVRKAADFGSAKPAKATLSRGARKSLERSGYKVSKSRANGYQVAKPRRVASYR